MSTMNWKESETRAKLFLAILATQETPLSGAKANDVATYLGCTPKAVTHQFTALRKEIDQLKSGDLPTASPKTPTNVGKKRKAKKEDDDGNESPSPSPAKKAKAKATPKKGAAGAAGKKGATGTGKKAKQAVEEGAGDEGESGEMGEDGDGDVAARKDAADGKVKDEVEVEDEGESEGVDAGDE